MDFQWDVANDVLVSLVTATGVFLGLFGCRQTLLAALLVGLLGFGGVCYHLLDRFSSSTAPAFNLGVGAAAGLVVSVVLAVFSRTRLVVLVAANAVLMAAFLLSLPIAPERQYQTAVLAGTTGAIVVLMLLLTLLRAKTAVIFSTSVLGSFFVLVGLDYALKTGVALAVFATLAALVRAENLMQYLPIVWFQFLAWGIVDGRIGVVIVSSSVFQAVLFMIIQTNWSSRHYDLMSSITGTARPRGASVDSNSDIESDDQANDEPVRLDDETQRLLLAGERGNLTTYGGPSQPSLYPMQQQPIPYQSVYASNNALYGDAPSSSAASSTIRTMPAQQQQAQTSSNSKPLPPPYVP